jgi:nitrogen-specific signal transduction histidine kinase
LRVSDIPSFRVIVRGLSISWDIVTQQHGGTIEVDSRPGEFTDFTVRLPRSFSAAPNEKSAVSS